MCTCTWLQISMSNGFEVKGTSGRIRPKCGVRCSGYKVVLSLYFESESANEALNQADQDSQFNIEGFPQPRKCFAVRLWNHKPSCLNQVAKVSPWCKVEKTTSPTEFYMEIDLKSLQKSEKGRLKLARHCKRSRDQVVSDLVLWQPTHGQRSRGRPNKMYINQLYVKTPTWPVRT